MAGLTTRVTRTMSQSSRRFLRDVAASVLATGVASLAFSHLAHERGPREAPVRAVAKFDERLSWRTEDIPTRQTTTYDTVAMFSLPLSSDTAWSEASVRTDAAPTNDPAKLDTERTEPVRVPRVRTALAMTRGPAAENPDRAPRPVSAALPPARPGDLAPAAVVAEAAATPDAGPRPIRVLGWALPGSDLIPSGNDALRSVASLGGRAVALGDTIVQTVGLR